MFEFETFPVLATDRLVLREWELSDAQDMFSFRSDPVTQIYNSEPMREVSEAAAMIENLRTAYTAGEQIQWAVTVRPDDRPIGWFGFNYWQRFHRRAEVGYDLARAHWGRGYAYEGMAAIIRFGFEEMGLHRIETETILDNVRSIRLLERLGFQREGVRREYSLEDDGAFHASTIWGLLAHECHIF
jgi:[ribosomal protein S5]-alanine N-acetyltransferase